MSNCCLIDFKNMFDSKNQDSIQDLWKIHLKKWDGIGGGYGRHRSMPHMKTYMKVKILDKQLICRNPELSSSKCTTGQSHKDHMSPVPVASSCNGSILKIEEDIVEASWLFLTSSNLSKAAHGDLCNCKGTDKLKILSYELGILFRSPMRLERNFSLTPDHPVLGINTPVQEMKISKKRKLLVSNSDKIQNAFVDIDFNQKLLETHPLYTNYPQTFRSFSISPENYIFLPIPYAVKNLESFKDTLSDAPWSYDKRN